MSVKDLVTIIANDGRLWAVIIIILTSLIQISPLKFNPWSKVAEWLGRALNKSVIDKVEEIDKKIQEVDKKLADHITESENKALQDTRSEILSFGSAIVYGTNYTKEQFDFMIASCDRYEKHCRDNNIINGVADATIKEIRRVYSLRLSQDTFLKQGDDK